LSLKTVHILFIAISTLLAFGFSLWAFNLYAATGQVAYLITGIVSLLFGAILIVYGKRFLQKLKHVSYM